jgi:hypothetical protein
MLKKLYIILFNLLMLLGWIKIFHDLILGYHSSIGLYASIEKSLKLVQTFAFLGKV